MRLNILLVDDDKKLLSVLKSLLTEEGHHVSIFSNGLEAVNACSDREFDLVISDVMMPGANGMEVLKATRKAHPDTPVILITGFASLETAVQAIREGAYDYITKPFKMEELKIIVKNAEEKIRLTRENQRLLQELQDAYQQLHSIKKIMLGEESETGSCSEGSSPVPFIAGSLLPHSYIENKVHPGTFFLTDVERLAVLKEKGFLSEEEFQLCKARLLKSLQP